VVMLLPDYRSTVTGTCGGKSSLTGYPTATQWDSALSGVGNRHAAAL